MYMIISLFEYMLSVFIQDDLVIRSVFLYENLILHFDCSLIYVIGLANAHQTCVLLYIIVVICSVSESGKAFFTH